MKTVNGKKEVPIYHNGEFKVAKMDGIEFGQHYISTFTGKNHCYLCREKLGLFGYKEVYVWLGINYRLCKDCFKENKKFLSSLGCWW